MRTASRLGRACLACTSGIAALEFALVAPILLTLLIGTLEFSRWSTARQHMEDYAFSVATDLSGTPRDITPTTLEEMMYRIGIIAPELVDPTKNAWQAGDTTYLGVTISMYNLESTVLNCRTNCSYTAINKWTFGNNRRDCDARPSFTGASQPGPIVVVDVTSQYKFVFDVRNRLAAAPTLTTTIWLPLRNYHARNAPIPDLDIYSGWTGPWRAWLCK